MGNAKPFIFMTIAVLAWGVYPLGMKMIATAGSIPVGMILMKTWASLAALLTLFALVMWPGVPFRGRPLIRTVGRVILAWPTNLVVVVAVPLTAALYYFQLLSFQKAGLGDVTVTIVIELWPVLAALLLTVACSPRVRLIDRADYGLKAGDTIYLVLSLVGYCILVFAHTRGTGQRVSLEAPPFWLATATAACVLQAMVTTLWYAVFEQVRKVLPDRERGRWIAAVVVEAVQRPGILVVLLLLHVAGAPILDNTLVWDGEMMRLTALYAVIVLAFGNVFFMLGLGYAERASITFLWYLMPAFAILLLSIYNARWLTGFEVSAAMLIIIINVFLNINVPFIWALKGFFFGLAALGSICYFVDPMEGEFYYSLASLPAIFYGLLAAYALTRLQSRLSDIQADLLDLMKKVPTLINRIPWTAGQVLLLYVRLVGQLIVRDVASKPDHDESAHLARIVRWRARTLRAAEQHPEMKAEILDIVSNGDRITARHGQKLTIGELISLLSLLMITVVFNIIYRDPSVAGDIFAVSLSAAAIFVFALILEFDKLRTNEAFLVAVIRRTYQDLGRQGLRLKDKEKRPFWGVRTPAGSIQAHNREAVIVIVILLALTIAAVTYLILASRGVLGPVGVPVAG